MPEQTIICPNCGKEISITESLSHQVRENLQKELDKRVQEKEKEFEKRKKLLEKEVAEKLKVEKEKFMLAAKKEAKIALEVELKDLQAQNTEKDKMLEKARRSELTFRKKTRELEAKEKVIEIEVARKIDTAKENLKKKLDEQIKAKEQEVSERLRKERLKISKEAQKEAKSAFAVELKDLQEQNNEKERKLEEARKSELLFRKKMRALEDKEKEVEVEVARKIDAERDKVRQQALELFSEEHRLKDHEKEKKINDMRKTIEELKRKADQGSMQTQGEVLELDLENLLRTKFPVDEIAPVPKGIRGADVVQRVHNKSGHYCGAIIWESKRTKSWSNGWISKLKDDQRAIKAEIAVLATEAMPKDMNSFAQINGIWVTSLPLAGSVAEALRAGLIQVSQIRLASVSKDKKMEVLYNYLSGSEFKQKIEAIVESFKSMSDDLERERRAMTRIWSKREKQIERVITSTVGMYGDMQGIIGTSMPKIQILELEDGD